MSRAGSQPKPKQATPRPLMGIAQIAEWLGVGERHVRRLISERRIPYVKWGHYIRFDPGQVDEWLGSNRIAPMRALGGAEAAPRRVPEPAPTPAAAMDDEDQDEEFRACPESSSQEIQERPPVSARTIEDVSSREEGS